MGFKQRRERSGSEHFYVIRVNLPLSLFNIVMDKAEKMGLPASNLIAYAIDNELEKPVPFEYPCEIPTNAFIEDAYIEEGSKILRHITKVGPLPFDQIVLARRDLGIPDKISVLLGIREILRRKSLVELLWPSWVRWHKFPRHILFLVAKGQPTHKQDKIERLKKRLAQLEGINAEENNRSAREESSDGSETDE